MPVKRPGGKKRDTSKADKLVKGSGNDPEVVSEAPAKPARKTGKSSDPNYRKQMLYLPVDIADKLKREAFESSDQDMSDIVAEVLAERYSGS